MMHICKNSPSINFEFFKQSFTSLWHWGPPCRITWKTSYHTPPGGNNLLCGKHNEPLGNHQQKFSESVRQTRTTDRHLPYLSCQAHQRENDCTTASMHGSHLAVRKCLVSFHLHSIQKRPGHSRFIEQALGLLIILQNCKQKLLGDAKRLWKSSE